MWFEAGSDVTIETEYLVEGEYVVPTSASFRLRNHLGASVFSSGLTAGSTQEEITIPAIHNSISNLWENRYLLVEFVVGSRTYRKQIVYRLSDFVPVTAQAADVRSALGLDEKELLDSEVEPLQAYFRLAEEMGSTFADAFTSAGTRNWAANRCVVLRCALDIARSLPMRTRISIRTEDSAETRSDKIDFDSIVEDLQAELASLKDTALGTVASTPTIFALSTPTDLFGG